MSKPKLQNVSAKIMGRRDWPTWEEPDHEMLIAILKKVTPFVKFLEPQIIEAVQKDNSQNKEYFENWLHSFAINPSKYLWTGSPCAFPGIRRFVGNSETKRSLISKNSTALQQAVYLDDNQYPRHIWAFAFLGKPSPSQGPRNYSLSHLIDHKEYNNDRFAEEIIVSENTDLTLHGLFTSPANVFYINNSVYKATDFQSNFRRILQCKAKSLYKDVCNLLPPGFEIAPLSDSKLAIENFEWSQPVGSVDFMDSFFKYRLSELQRMGEESIQTRAG